MGTSNLDLVGQKQREQLELLTGVCREGREGGCMGENSLIRQGSQPVGSDRASG